MKKIITAIRNIKIVKDIPTLRKPTKSYHDLYYQNWNLKSYVGYTHIHV